MITLHDDVSDAYRVAQKYAPALLNAVVYQNASAFFWAALSDGKMRAAELSLSRLADMGR